MNFSRFVGPVMLAVAVGGCAGSASAEAVSPPADRKEDVEYDRGRNIEPMLRRVRAKHGLPALAAAVIRRGTLLTHAAVGVRKLGEDVKVTAHDRFHIGSCTKAMTATLVQGLVEQGTLAWPDTLAETFPDLADRMHEAYRSVTLLELAAHRGGMPGKEATWPAGLTFRQVHDLPGPPREQRRAYVEKILAQAPVAKPGTTFLYSNAGYVVLGAACEERMNVAYEALMRLYIFEPLKMASAGFGPPGRAPEVDQPWPHRSRPTGLVPVEPGDLSDNPPAVAPGGRVHCSIGDWARFVGAHLDGARGRPTPLAVKDWKRLHEPPFDGTYALGWGTVPRRWAGGMALTHTGSNTMNFAVVWMAPKRDFAVLVATNAGGDEAPKACDEVAAALIDEYLRTPRKPELLDARKIWDRAPHNAFTDLLRHKDEWLCVFREGAGHVSHDGAIRVIASDDGETWTSAAHIETPDASLPDLRDPKICHTPDGRLLLIAGAANRREGQKRHRTIVWFSDDGRRWGDATPVADENVWLWRVTWHKGKAYAVGYGREGAERIARLYRSDDGRRFRVLVPRLFHKGYPNEATLRFLPDGRCLCLLRRDGRPNTAQLGTASPPYTAWSWKDLGVRVGGPNFIRLPGGRFLACTRLYDGGTRTSLQWLNPEKGTLTEVLRLPSGGDTSYAGLAVHQGLLWVSYYSSHEGKTSIYLARMRLPAKE